jgi:plastocyanin domain-containing protein
MSLLRRRTRQLVERRIRIGRVCWPEATSAPAGMPVRLTFRREGVARRCAAIVFPALGRLVTLPGDGDVVVDFSGLAAGEYDFSCTCATACGTSGRLVVGLPGATVG